MRPVPVAVTGLAFLKVAQRAHYPLIHEYSLGMVFLIKALFSESRASGPMFKAPRTVNGESSECGTDPDARATQLIISFLECCLERPKLHHRAHCKFTSTATERAQRRSLNKEIGALPLYSSISSKTLKGVYWWPSCFFLEPCHARSLSREHGIAFNFFQTSSIALQATL